jgi:hypothetical protein
MDFFEFDYNAIISGIIIAVSSGVILSLIKSFVGFAVKLIKERLLKKIVTVKIYNAIKRRKYKTFIQGTLNWVPFLLPKQLNR